MASKKNGTSLKIKRLLYDKNLWSEHRFMITISPRPRWGDMLFNYDADKFLIRKALMKCTDHFLIYPELDKHDRLHYHGVIQVKDRIKWYKSGRKALAHIGFTKVEKITSYASYIRWIHYMSKDWWINKDIFPKQIFPYRRHRKAKAKRTGAVRYI